MFKHLGRGIGGRELLVHRDRFLRLPRLTVGLRQVLVHMGILRPEIDRLLIILDGLGRLLQLGIGKTETAVEWRPSGGSSSPTFS